MSFQLLPRISFGKRLDSGGLCTERVEMCLTQAVLPWKQ